MHEYVRNQWSLDDILYYACKVHIAQTGRHLTGDPSSGRYSRWPETWAPPAKEAPYVPAPTPTDEQISMFFARQTLRRCHMVEKTDKTSRRYFTGREKSTARMRWKGDGFPPRWQPGNRRDEPGNPPRQLKRRRLEYIPAP